MRIWLARLAAAAAIGAVLAACGDGQNHAQTLLTRAKTLLDAANSAHFTLTSSGAGGAAVVLRGGGGDILRPDRFSGTLEVDLGGFALTVPAVAGGGAFYVRNPLTGGFETADPSEYGFADPSHLMDRQTGLSSLLLRCQNAAQTRDDRLQGELLHEVSCSLPGQAVKALLTDAAPDKPVTAAVGMAADSGQLRRVVLTGPFYSSTASNTFTLVVDKYGENVTITPPPAGA